MNRYAKPAAAGRPPPRLAFAVAAAAAAVAVHAAVFGLFDQHAQHHARLAAAAGERAYAACVSERDRARRRVCLDAAVARARPGTAVAMGEAR
ncbi:MAG: hypothetical protein HYZ20_05240 [Burkholderiales bacterium]|nr:hypothetical protein [Burkholderiales bacterium]